MKIDIAQHVQQKPAINLAPLIDIVFITLVFFVTLLVYQQMETEISISVPKAEESKEVTRSPGEIIINIDKSGQMIVNQRQLDMNQLREMLKRISSLYPDQPIIIRADKKTYHESVVGVLDACAAANIWNISFSTLKEDK
jgi:biopolymer transport protein ExbD